MRWVLKFESCAHYQKIGNEPECEEYRIDCTYHPECDAGPDEARIGAVATGLCENRLRVGRGIERVSDEGTCEDPVVRGTSALV